MASVTDDEEEEEEAFEESSNGNRFLGFMFGNVDNSGDLDVDYLDEDAKEHLAALADKLGPSLKEIDLSIKSLPPDSSEQDFGEKAEDAVDYEDIDEQYEGPETLGHGEEDRLLPKKDFHSFPILSEEHQSQPVFDDEDYDDIEENENNIDEQPIIVEASQNRLQVQSPSFPDENEDLVTSGDEENVFQDSAVEEEDDYSDKEENDGSLLPVLCVENGRIILRFSEIFGIQKPQKKVGKKEQRFAFKDKYKWDNANCFEEDDEDFLRSEEPWVPFQHRKDDSGSALDCKEREESNEMIRQKTTSFVSAEPLREDESAITSQSHSFDSIVYPMDQLDWEQNIVWGDSPSDSFDDRCVPLGSPRGEEREPHGSLSLTYVNQDMIEDRWLEDIIWDSKPVNKPKLILDLQDDKMLFHLSDNSMSETIQEHATATIVPPAAPRVALGVTGWQFNIANDRFYVKGKTTQQLQTTSSKTNTYGVRVHHSAPAVKLQTMKHRLSNKDLANFHRPKALWYPHDIDVAVRGQEKVGTMKVILKSMGGKGTKLHVSADETLSCLKGKAAKKLDFKLSEEVRILYLGRELEDSKPLAAQDVRPNSLLHLVRTRVHLLPRAQRIPGDNKSLRPPGAFKKKSDLSVRDGHVFLMEYCEERPLLLSNPGMGANLCCYYQKQTTGDQAALSLGNHSTFGSIVSLEPSEKSPFIGEIRAGCTASALVTNMYRSPVFPHNVPSTDFLLVRSSKGKLSLRRIDKIAVVGQQEPLMEVYTPGSKNVQAFMLNRLLAHVYRQFRDAEKRGAVAWIRVDELSAMFPHLSETILKKKLKECAVMRKDGRGHWHWCKKRDFVIPSEEEIKKLVSPENVCAYESMQSGLYHLKHMGITKMTVPTGVSAAVSQLPDEAITLAAASFIERELLITQWSLTSNFVSCLNQDRDNIERLEITGVGDPSGRGLGFSYVRAAPISAAAKKKTSVARGMSSVTGTDADLRRLSMDAAREVLMKLNVPEEQIVKMTRWHRIAMIRKLSSEQAASVDPAAISKYARGQRMSFLQLQQQTREKCQEIWDRQMQSLSSFEHDENLSDSDENSDLDSFAGDLENLLDAEEFDEEKAEGIKMRRRPSVLQKVEDIEDEEAEAAELFKLLMHDEADHKKKRKPKIVPPKVDSSVIAPETLQKEGLVIINKESENKIKKKRPIVKSENTNTPIAPRIKIVSENIKPIGFKEKKSARDSFVCGACGQLGHMKTNKHCPKYGEPPEPPPEPLESEKIASKSISDANKVKRSIKAEPTESEKSISKSKAVPVKIKCGGPDDHTEDHTEAGSKPPPKLTKIKISNKFHNDKPSVIIKPPAELQRAPSLIIKPPSIVIRPPADREREHSHKKIVIKKPKEMVDVDEGSAVEHRKTKKIMELTGIEKRETSIRRYEEEEDERIAEIRKYEELIWSEREEEARIKAKKKKKMSDEKLYVEEYKVSKRISDRGAKRRVVAEESQAKRRRGGEVGLANILESIVEILKSKTEISYLFLKPVSKKEAPDYYHIIKQPMDLSTIRDKARKMEYRSREEFRHDVCQITINAHRYNDQRHPAIPPLADQLLEICDYLLLQHHHSLTQAEDRIEI